jgi:hypothetical protein
MARFVTIETNRLGTLHITQYHGRRPLIRAIAKLANIIVSYALLTILRSLTTSVSAAVVRGTPLLVKTTLSAV